MQISMILLSTVLGITGQTSASEGKTATPTDKKVVHVVNTEESTIAWKAYKVTGKHNGEITLRKGNLEFTGSELTGGSFEIDMQTIEVLDLSGNNREKLEGHLKSDDFFGVSTFPKASFEITDAIPYGTNGQYKIVGDLTIKGISKEIKFMAQVNGDETERTATANIKVDRSDFNVRYGSGSFFDNLGDKTIYDEFDLVVTLKTNLAS